MTVVACSTRMKNKREGTRADGDEVEITKHGRVVARLAPATGPHALKGSFAGVATTAADDEDLFSTGAAWNLE